jgi:hypothetical protein
VHDRIANAERLSSPAAGVFFETKGMGENFDPVHRGRGWNHQYQWWAYSIVAEVEHGVLLSKNLKTSFVFRASSYLFSKAL